MKTIYKYRIESVQDTLTIPYRCNLLTVGFDGNEDLCAWFLHDIEPDRFRKFQFMVMGTGWETEEPLLEMPCNGDKNPFGYITTVKSGPLIWHVFMRELLE